MKFADSLVSMIGDFAAMKRTPDYQPQETPVPAKTEDENKGTGSRRHSLNISIGTEEIPTIIPRRIRSESICVTTSGDPRKYNKTNRRYSSSCCIFYFILLQYNTYSSFTKLSIIF
uniref:Uncharacterized protein n=1 Tax=Heterorhabditis bacteriophora TaxID=37862 RepID=A0A1I7XJ75_HETBA